MPYLVAFIYSYATTIVAKVLLSLGFSYVVYQGLDGLTTLLIQQINNSSSLIPAEMAMILGRCGIFTAMSIVVSSYISSFSLMSALNGAKRLIMNYSAQA